MKEKITPSPIFQALSEHRNLNSLRFHVPGHKGGFFFPKKAQTLYSSILEIDFTELSGLDDLHDPQGMIVQAQELAASCFYAEQTHFLIGGSTVGNLAMLLGSLQRGDQVLVQRNSHKSIFHALAMIEAQAIILEPHICSSFGVPTGLNIEQIKQAMQHFSNIQGIVLTYPNYYGMAAPLKEIIDLAHHKAVPIFVDEAHGAHFGQHASLPSSAMQLGADVSVQSTHKMLTSMTMSAMLHVQGNRVSREDIEYYLHSLQSSSPSYPLLASLDLAREYIQRVTEQQWNGALQEYMELRETIRSHEQYIVNNSSSIGMEMDPFKLVIQPQWGITGYQLQFLLEKHQIYTELADPYNVLLTLPISPNKSWNEKLIVALQQIAKENDSEQQESHNKLFPEANLQEIRDPVTINMRVLRSIEKETVKLVEAVGRRAAEMLIPYPPGIPILIPGEEIRPEVIQDICKLRDLGTYFQGKGSSDFNTIQVIKEELR